MPHCEQNTTRAFTAQASLSFLLFGSFDFDRIQSCAAHRGHRRAAALSLSFSPLFGKVRFISGVWSLRGSKSRQPTSSHGLCRVRCAHGIAIDRSEKERRRARTPGRSGTRASRRKFDPPLFDLASDAAPTSCAFVRPPAETTATHQLRGSDYFSRLTKCLVLSREISDPTLRGWQRGSLTMSPHVPSLRAWVHPFLALHPFRRRSF